MLFLLVCNEISSQIYIYCFINFKLTYFWFIIQLFILYFVFSYSQIEIALLRDVTTEKGCPPPPNVLSFLHGGISEGGGKQLLSGILIPENKKYSTDHFSFGKNISWIWGGIFFFFSIKRIWKCIIYYSLCTLLLIALPP